MYVGTQTKKLARTVLLFSVSSLSAIFFCTVAARPNAVADRSVSVPIYTYQNPFGITASASSSAFKETRLGGRLAQLVSAKSLLGLSGLATLWLVSSWYLSGEWAKRQRNHRKIRDFSTNVPARMNPLAVIPKPIVRVSKTDGTRPVVPGQTGTRSLFTHRKTTAPCQSRFRPVTLVSSQTRLGRLK
ncbi:MAG TPA: hypothetical protein VKU37_03300 [Verrucomicrobiae bacterium]|nr:hypothetical protein [Verrucomicrobiae bacterium]